MGPVFSMRPEKFAACAGFDALAYVQALSLMLRVSAWVALVVVVMVLPTNWTGSAVEKKLAIQESDPVFQQLCSEVPTGEAEDEVRAARPLPSRPPAKLRVCRRPPRLVWVCAKPRLTATHRGGFEFSDGDASCGSGAVVTLNCIAAGIETARPLASIERRARCAAAQVVCAALLPQGGRGRL